MGGTGNGHMGAGNAGRGGFNNDGGGSGSDRPGFNDMKIGTWNDAPATSNGGNTSGNGNCFELYLGRSCIIDFYKGFFN